MNVYNFLLHFTPPMARPLWKPLCMLLLPYALAVCRHGRFTLMKRGVALEWCFVCVHMSHMLQNGMEQFFHEWLCIPCSISWSCFTDALHRQPHVAGLNWLNHLIAKPFSDSTAGLVDHVKSWRLPSQSTELMSRDNSGLLSTEHIS